MTKPISKSLMGATSMLMILSVLRQKDSYGYEISKIILKVSDGRIDWQAGSLYPMLKKMEKQGLIKSVEKPDKLITSYRIKVIIKPGAK